MNISVNRQACFIGFACGIGARHNGSRSGPGVLKRKIQEQNIMPSIMWNDLIEHDDVFIDLQSIDALPLISALSAQLALNTYTAIKKQQFPIVIGGDHSSGIGTWSGVAAALRNQGDLGLIWVDAHLDSHTTTTTHSGYIHGMPVAALLGYGDKSIINIIDCLPKIKPQNLVFIGARDYEQEELDFLQQHNVKVYFMSDVKQRGFESLLAQAVADLQVSCQAIGLSIDIDGMDPHDAPAVASKIADGIRFEQLLAALPVVKNCAKFAALEIAEYNPQLDDNDKTFRVIEQIIGALVYE